MGLVMNGRIPIIKTDDLDILSGIWIMSCNDDNPIMTYRSISQRLNLPETYDVKAVVRNRPELFRQGILKSRLNAWKDKMKSGLSRPNWIVEIHDAGEQRKTINSLTRDDVFRNQFRVEDEAGKCDLQIIEWGLQHIDRLRKAAAEEKEAGSRWWTSFIIPLVSLGVAIVSVIGTVSVQWFSIREQAASKRYEVDFRPKQQAYSSFMLAINLIVGAVAAQNGAEYLAQMDQMELAFFSLEPFLSKQRREAIRAQYQDFLDLCNKQLKRPRDQSAADKDTFLSKVAAYEVDLKDQLYRGLFESN